MLNGVATLLEKLPGFSFRSGLILAFIGAALDISIRFGIVSKDALDGYVAQAAPVLWVVGAAMMISVFVLAVLSWVATFRKVPANWLQRRSRRKRLIGNISFLNDEARLLLLAILKLPNGRIESLGECPPFQRLYDLDLIAPEISGLLFMGGVPHGMMKVAPEIYSVRKELVPHLESALSDRLGVDVRDERILGQQIEAARNRRENMSIGPDMSFLANRIRSSQ